MFPSHDKKCFPVTIGCFPVTISPSVRGVAMNPSSHPHGGGEGRSGIGLKSPKTYAGRKAVGKTRQPKKYSNKFIIKRRGVK